MVSNIAKMQFTDLTWLPEFLAALPHPKKRRKNIYEIAGFPRWENVNSNVLAFYLQEKEQHGLQRLFLESLLELAAQQQGWKENERFDVSNDDYVVMREVGTVDQKRIDLLIQPKAVPFGLPSSEAEPKEEAKADWAIVIENKIDADLYNHLHIYADHTKASQKLLIVLSVYPIGDDGHIAKMQKHGFINLLHRDLIAMVRTRLPQYIEEADDRHILFLKDYFSSVERLYEDPMASQENEALLAQFHKYNEGIWRIEQESVKLLNYVTESAIKAMDALGYECDTKYAATGKHFRRKQKEDKDGERKGLRFWIWLDGLRLHGHIVAFYEAYGNAQTEQGAAARVVLNERYGRAHEGSQDKVLQTGIGDGVRLAQKGGAGAQYCQLFRMQLPLLESDGDLSFRIQKAIQRGFIDAGYLHAAKQAFFNAGMTV